jgi:hypothetical protein
MPYLAAVYNVMIASPGDVTEEREIVRRVLHDWNNLHAEERQIVLLPIGWETDSAPGMDDTAQEIINQQVLARADMVIGIFWTRIGTPTKEAVSGTVEEIEKHVAAGKHAMIYFSDAPVAPSKLNHEQYAGVQEFRKQCQAKGYYAVYDSTADFETKLEKHITRTIQHHPMFKESPEINLRVELEDEIPSSPAELSPESWELLRAAVTTEQPITLFESLGGAEIGVRGQVTVQERDNRRTFARYRAALKELQNADLIEDPSGRGEIYDVTEAGYRLVENTPPVTAHL